VFLGALNSAEDLLELAQGAQGRLEMLANDPRPAEEKPAVLAGEVEAVLDGLLEAGEEVESELLALLPEEVRAAVPEGFLGRDAVSGSGAAGAPGSGEGEAGAGEGEGEDDGPEETAESLAEGDFAERQASGELSDLAFRTGAARDALEALRAAPSEEKGMQRLNLSETRDRLRQRLEEMRSDPGLLDVGDAMDEASAVLADVNAALEP
jgi:hypothetical protein